MSHRRLSALLTLCLATFSLARAELPIVTKARTYLGPESALNAVKSIHYTGSMLAPDAADPTKSVTVTIDIIFQEPYRQRTIRSTDTVVDTSALNGYDSWHRMQDPKHPDRWRMQLLPKDQIKRQRAIVWENLSFFRGLEQEGGKVLDQGPATIDGIACRKIAFVHADDVIFYRYFDEASGRLILSETETGGTIREQGEIMVNGIRFPKMIINTAKGPDGKEQTVTITFDHITANESFPTSIFAIPSFAKK